MSELQRNIPGHPNWEGSFYEILTEYAEWNHDAFWRLHLELTEIAQAVDQNQPVDRALALNLLTLQEKVMHLQVCHHDPKDSYVIQNISRDQLRDFMERFDYAIRGALSGEVLPETKFELINPLIAS